MTIQIKPEQEQVIGQAIQAGLIKDADQAVELGMQTIRERLKGRHKKVATPAGDLPALFANSPFAGLDMDFERDQDVGRTLEF
jgi:hypothetical protein